MLVMAPGVQSIGGRFHNFTLVAYLSPCAMVRTVVYGSRSMARWHGTSLFRSVPVCPICLYRKASYIRGSRAVTTSN